MTITLTPSEVRTVLVGLADHAGESDQRAAAIGVIADALCRPAPVPADDWLRKPTQPGTILDAWRRIEALIGREGTSPASVVDRVAYLVEQAERLPRLRVDVRRALGRWHADDSDVPDAALVEYVEDAVRQANKTARP